MNDVLIVGAGPTGLTLACELRRRGVDCRVIDQRTVHVDRSRAVDVQSRTLHVFDDLGIADDVLLRGRLLRGLSVYDRARRMARIDYRAADTPFPFAVALPQSDTERLLERRLVELGGRVERGVQLRALQACDGGVEVTTREDGGERVARYAWVIGCDGVASTVRDLSGIAFDAVGAEQSFIAADAVVRWAFPDDELALFLADESFLLALPLPGDGGMRLIADVPPDGGAQPDLAAFAAMVRERLGTEVSLEAPGLIGTYHVRQRRAAAFRKGRVLLAGDAAHSYNPVGGHGMNQGIQDAYNLGWKLALVLRGRADEDLLDSYAVERLAVARDFARDMDFGARLALSQQEVSREERDRLLDFAVKSTTVRRSVLDAAVPHLSVYDDSSITSEVVVGKYVTPAGVSAGNFAPDVRLGDESVVALLRGTEHVLLLLCGSERPDAAAAVAVATQVRDRLGDVVRVTVVAVDGQAPRWDGQLVRDAAGALHARYGGAEPCAYLVRPDGHIGFRSCPLQVEALLGHLRRVFSA